MGDFLLQITNVRSLKFESKAAHVQWQRNVSECPHGKKILDKAGSSASGYDRGQREVKPNKL
jgi:hypothetical protein